MRSPPAPKNVSQKERLGSSVIRVRTYPQRRKLTGEFDEDRGLVRDTSVDVDSFDAAILKANQKLEN